MAKVIVVIEYVDGLICRFARMLISGYQLFLSPWLGGGCRFTPTCSSYAMSVFRTHSFPKALYLTVRRILRCHPFCAGGEDPPPGKDDVEINESRRRDLKFWPWGR